MHLEEINQDIAIASLVEAESMVAKQPDYWNVISIRDGFAERPRLMGAKDVLHLRFDDIEDTFMDLGGTLATEGDIIQALKFARGIKNEPLMIHCTAGVSRSTAIAWILIYDKLRGQDDAAHRALQIVHTLRPAMMPNKHVLRVGIKVLTRDKAEREQIRRDLAVVL